MESLTNHVLQSFLAHWPRLQANPHELAGRLQRRHHAILTRPPRAWCIALRAGDTRLTPLHTILDDCHAPAQHRSHTVTITAPLVRRLCAPVFIDAMGEPAADVAARLGIPTQGLAYLIRTGFFRVRRVPGLGGQRGKPVPILHHDTAAFGEGLDPQSRSFRPPLPAWGSLWPYHASAIPNDFEQPVPREPEFQNTRWGQRFTGWTWRCPACCRTTAKLYYPLPVPDVASYLGLAQRRKAQRRKGGDVRREEEEDFSSLTSYALRLTPLPPPPHTFACGRCHRVTHLSRIDPNSWNELVTHLTAGLLYGREVPKPADWSHRTNTKVRRPHARPAVRRSEVCRLLTETDLPRAAIATHFGLSRGTINVHVEDVFDQYGVHSREELKERVKLIIALSAPIAMNCARRQHNNVG